MINRAASRLADALDQLSPEGMRGADTQLLQLAAALRPVRKVELSEDNLSSIQRRMTARIMTTASVSSSDLMAALRPLPLQPLSESRIKALEKRILFDIRPQAATVPEAHRPARWWKRSDGPRLGLVLMPHMGAGLKQRFAALSERARRLGSGGEAVLSFHRASEAVAALVAVAVISGVVADRPVAPETPTQAQAAPSPIAASQAPADQGASQILVDPSTVGDVLAYAGDAVAPGREAQPEDASFSSMTASPSYSYDRTLFASGLLGRGCARPACPALFSSHDGGATWQSLSAQGFAGGQIILPPSYPTDKRIFASGVSGLQVSADGGATFATIATVPGPAAISPAFHKGDPRILIGATPLWAYRDDLGTASPMAAAVGAGAVSNLVFAPSYPKDDRLLVGGTTFAAGSPQASAVFVCRDDCRLAGLLQGSKGAPELWLSPDFLTDNTVFALASGRLYSSHNGGASFTPVPTPAPFSALALDPGFGASNSTLYASSLGDSRSVGGVFASHDAGATWARLGASEEALSSGAGAVFTTSTGRLIALPAAGQSSAGGLLCSADAGKTWARRCESDKVGL